MLVTPVLEQVHADGFEQQLVRHRRRPFQVLLAQTREPTITRRFRRQRPEVSVIGRGKRGSSAARLSQAFKI